MEKVDRRKFFRGVLGGGVLLAGTGTLLASCGGGQTESSQTNVATADTVATDTPAIDRCSDFSDVDDAEMAKREMLGYVEKTPIPEHDCSNCKLFIPWGEDLDCGGCQLFKGPVTLRGYCTYWADPSA